jgi:hypothetical protein
VYGVERYVLGEMMNNAHYEMFNELWACRKCSE